MKFFQTILILFLIFIGESFSQQLLSLQDAVKIALENNFSINIAKNKSIIADNDANIGNAGFLPNLDATGSYSKSQSDTKQEYFDGRTIDRTGAKSTNLSAGISLNWTVFDGFEMFGNLDLLKELNRIGKASYKSEIENNVAEVIDNYFNLIREKQVLDVIKETIRISEERVRIAESKKDVGSGSKFDLRQAQVDLNEDRSTLLKEELTYEQLKVMLNQLLGRDVNTDFDVEDTIIVNENLNYDELMNSALQKNSELFIAERNLELAEINISLARSELYPRISLSGGYNYLNSESGAGFIKTNKNYSLNFGVTASLNLFNGLNTRRKIENALVESDNSRLNYEMIKNSIEANLLNVYKKYLNSIKLIKLEEENLIIAEESVDIALERLKLGNITPLEFRETQRKLIDVKSRLVSAQYEAKTAETELLRLSGLLVRE